MTFLICLASLCFLMFVAYRGYSVILFAPVAAMGAVLLTDPAAVPPIFTGLFMERMVVFVKLYFPVFLLGAVFGKVIEMSGFAKSIVASCINVVGRERAIIAIVAVCCILTYGGVSLFVAVFAVYPFAAEMFRQGNIPKRLIPGTIALGAFTATMTCFPGSPQIQNIIPTTFFKTDTWAAPLLGSFAGIFILVLGILWLEWRLHQAVKAGEGYGTGHINEPEAIADDTLVNPILAITPLVLVLVLNFLFTEYIPVWYGAQSSVSLIPGAKPIVQPVASVKALWAVEGALLIGILFVVACSFKRIAAKFAAGTQSAVAGSLLASLNTASEYGFGAVIAALPGFLVIREALSAIPNPMINIAISVTTLAGITGSASGGMGIALAAMSSTFIEMANAAKIPLEMLHRVASIASGGLDTLPHNGAVITLLNVTGLTHKDSYLDIFMVATLITLASVFVVIGAYYVVGSI